MEETNYNKLTKREKKELKNKKREQERLEREKGITKKKRNKKIFKWSISIIVIMGLISLGFFLFSGERVESYSGGQVHWHSRLNVYMCGDKIETPSPFGNAHVGSPLLHTHSDRLIHIEGTIYNPEDITIRKYMEAIGMNFKDDELIDKKNGDLCGDKAGKVKLIVNGIENQELTKYVIKDDEDYELRFE